MNDSQVNPSYSQFDEGGRYATLAAIVGIVNKKNNQSQQQASQPTEIIFLDYMDDSCPIDDDNLIVPTSSSIRLVGVGRAVLRKLYYQVPSELCTDEEQQQPQQINDFSIEYDDDDIDIDLMNNSGGYEDGTPIIMSRFEPLIDDSSTYASVDPDRIGEKGQRSYRSSPVHGMLFYDTWYPNSFCENDCDMQYVYLVNLLCIDSILS